MLEQYLKSLYPQGVMGGECIEWLHKVLEFPPVGDFVWQKKNFVSKNGDCITYPNLYGEYRIGDILFTTEGTTLGLGYGHGALITGITATELVLAESNFRRDKRVRYGRKISKTDPKIIGIGRFPFKKFNIPLKLKVTVMVNNAKWNNAVFDTVTKWFKDVGIEVEIGVIRTKFQNWWYEVVQGQFGSDTFKVMSKAYMENVVMPLRLPNSNFTLLVVNNKEWEGSVVNRPDVREIGWYFPKTNPGMAVIGCDEKDQSYVYDQPLIVHALIHEIMHYLYYVNGKQDNTHSHDSLGNLSACVKDLNLTRIALNI